ncbi:hypothetical protein NLU13_7770 [Sarocladium strictum]|uniref:CFEM domain-containing protein n=1 Tax=Sarocladium strictum TaxID=5046 RepID=A0AA39L648_SARSR|nr:hypothetical protein NLU13_7770 [Sarocladium strictum]
MKASLPLVVVSALAGFTAAQSMADALPSCATDCLNAGIKSATKCALDDAKCICEVDNYRNTYTAATACVLQACGAAKSLDEVLPAAAKFCNEVTGGATAPPVDESAPSTTASAAAAAAETSQATTATSASVSEAATQTTSKSADPTTESASAASSTDKADAAGSIGPMNVFAMVALGLAAVF